MVVLSFWHYLGRLEAELNRRHDDLMTQMEQHRRMAGLLRKSEGELRREVTQRREAEEALEKKMEDVASARRAIESVAALPDVVLPFPAGAVRSGSKVGSRYKKLIASTNDAYCPTLIGRVDTKLHDGATCAYEIVFDSLDEQSMTTAMRSAIQAAAGDGVLAITAGNYGGKLGKFHFHLREVVGES